MLIVTYAKNIENVFKIFLQIYLNLFNTQAGK